MPSGRKPLQLDKIAAKNVAQLDFQDKCGHNRAFARSEQRMQRASGKRGAQQGDAGPGDEFAVARAQLASLRKQFEGAQALAEEVQTSADNINQLARPGSSRRLPRDLCLKLSLAEARKFALDPLDNAKKWLERWGHTVPADDILSEQLGLLPEDSVGQLRRALSALSQAVGKSHVLNTHYLALAASCRLSQISAVEEFDEFLQKNLLSEVFLVYRWRGATQEEKKLNENAVVEWFANILRPPLRVRGEWPSRDIDFSIGVRLHYLANSEDELREIKKTLEQTQWFADWSRRVVQPNVASRNQSAAPLQVFFAVAPEDRIGSQFGDWTIFSSPFELRARQVVAQTDLMRRVEHSSHLPGGPWLWAAQSVRHDPRKLRDVFKEFFTFEENDQNQPCNCTPTTRWVKADLPIDLLRARAHNGDVDGTSSSKA